MVLDDVFAFITQQIATIASIFAITLSAARWINKRGDDRMTDLKKDINAHIEEKMRFVEQRIDFICKEMDRLDRTLERADEYRKQQRELNTERERSYGALRERQRGKQSQGEAENLYDNR